MRGLVSGHALPNSFVLSSGRGRVSTATELGVHSDVHFAREKSALLTGIIMVITVVNIVKVSVLVSGADDT